VARAEVGFGNENLAAHRRGLLAKQGHVPAHRGRVAVDGNAAQAGQGGDLHGAPIQCKRAQDVMAKNHETHSRHWQPKLFVAQLS